jgi:hypothetical protein
LAVGEINNSKDLLMLFLFAKGHQGNPCEPMTGRTRLMKMVFLFEKEIRQLFNLSKVIPTSALPDFEAYNFGPFAKAVYADLEFLQSLGFIEVRRTDDDTKSETESLEEDYWMETEGADDKPDTDYDEDILLPYRYSLTPTGEEFVREELLPNLVDEQLQALDEFKARCTSVSLNTLLKYVYTKYPESAKNSEIRDKVLKK